MKRNNSKRSCRTLISTFLQVSDVIGFKLWSQFGTMIMLVWSSQAMALLNGGQQGSNLYKLSPPLLFTWQHVEYTKWSWDPGGCAFALCSSERTWPTSLHYHAHLLWSSLQFSGAFLIWLVAWTMDGLEFSMGLGQTPFQGGRRSPLKPEGAATSDQLNGCCRQWDPGGLSVESAWGQAEFQGGRDVRSPFLTYRYGYLDRPNPATWAWPSSDPQEQVTYTGGAATQRGIQWITNKDGGGG